MLIVAGSGLLFGMTGFGFALVSVPPLLLLYPPATVVTITIGVSLLTSAIVVLDAWRELHRRLVASLLPGALAGLLVGLRILTAVDPAWLKALAGLVVSAYALLLLAGRQPHGLQHRWAPPLAGLASGALATSNGLSGPPIVMLLTARRLPVPAFRATIAAYFVALNLLALTILTAGRALDRHDATTTLVLIPPALLGTLAGNRLVRRLSAAQFRTLTLAMLLATGLTAVATVLAAFLYP